MFRTIFALLLVIGVHSQVSEIRFNDSTNILKWTFKPYADRLDYFSIVRFAKFNEESNAENIPECKHNVSYDDQQMEYNLTVQWPDYPSTTFEIKIQDCTENNNQESNKTNCKDPKSITYNTNPRKPFICPSTLFKCQDVQCHLNVPCVRNISLTSRMYIIVNNKSNRKFHDNWQPDELEQLKLQNDSVWIAKIINFKGGKKENTSIVIGDGSTQTNDTRMFCNRPLEERFCEYEFVILAVNLYREKMSSNYIIVSNECELQKNSSLLVGILIFLFVIIGLIGISVLAAIRGWHYKLVPCLFKRNPEPSVQYSQLHLTKIVAKRNMTVDKLKNFLQYCTDGGKSIEKEYEEIPVKEDKNVYGNQFPDKNRYSNILPYEDSRVILNQHSGDTNTNYINANYVEGYSGESKYIATQGPLDTTSEDFWRMIWETGTNTVVMLTNFVENEKKKCFCYWNENGSVTYGSIKVKHEDILEYIDYDVRRFSLLCDSMIREVQHYHFKTWPDKTTPQAPFGFTNFLKVLRSRIDINFPIVVHCSAGVGRTGVYIMCDYLLDMAEKEAHVDFIAALKHVRMYRMHMVQNAMQYKFSYCTVNEYLMNRNNNVSRKDFVQLYKNGIINTSLDQKIQLTKKDAYWHNLLYTKTTHFGWENNKHKQRSTREPTSCQTFISLPRYPTTDDESYYVDALIVPSQQLNKTYIATSQPLQQIQGDFWRLVEEYNCQIILSLHEVNLNDHTNKFFWPTDEIPLHPVDYLEIGFIGVEEKVGHNVIALQLTNHKNKTASKSRMLYLLDFKTWPGDGLPLVENFLKYYEDYNAFEERRSNKDSTILMCRDGTSGNGIFLSFLYIMERLIHDKAFDVCECISTLRLYREEYLENVEQLRFLHNCTYNFLDK